MLSGERLQLGSCSICSAGLWLLVAAAAAMTISPDAGPELIRGNGGRLWMLVAAASMTMIIFLDAGLLRVPHLV
jgi:hypothetical protein